MKKLVIALFTITLGACGGDGDSTNGGGPGNGGDTIVSILDGNQMTYTEMDEEGNSSAGGVEETNYTLDANGLEITGILANNSSMSSGDAYVFYSGESTSIDLQIMIDGEGLANNAPEFSTTFDAEDDDGVSTLFSNSFQDISILIETRYRIVVATGISDESALDKTYKIQIKASN